MTKDHSVSQQLMPEWMKSPPLQRLVSILGTESPLYCVGGCVRDTLLDRPVGDIDLATVLAPQTVQEALEKAGIKVFVWGIAHGTVTAYLEGQHFEITTLRQDIETDGRHAKVAFTTDLESDAKRRDFTINALYLDFHGKLYDPTGEGLKDLKAQRLAFIGKTEERLKEDYLRAYRYFRFCAVLDWDMNDDFLSLFQSMKDHYGLISSERKIHELTKIFSCPNPAKILLAMARGELIKLAGHSGEKERLSTYFEKQIRYNAYSFYSRFFACFFKGNDVVSGLSGVLPSAVIANIKNLSLATSILTQAPSVSAKELLYKFDREIALQAALWTDQNAELIEDILNQTIPAFPLTGVDVLKAGLSEGKEVGEAIKKAEQAWIASGFQLSLEECLEAAYIS